MISLNFFAKSKKFRSRIQLKKKFFKAWIVCMFAVMVVTQPIYAQNPTTRKLATRLVELQKQQNANLLALDLANTANRAVVDAWRPKLQQLPKSQQQRASTQLNAELKKFNNDNMRLLKRKSNRLNTRVLVPEYAKRFSAEELRQIIAFLESSAIKKYFTTNPQIADLLAQELLKSSRTDIEKRINAFDARAKRIMEASKDY